MVPASSDTLRLVMHPTQSDQIGEVLTRALNRALPNIDITIHDEIDGARVLAALQDARADIAFADADTAYGAFIGEADGRQFRRLRGIAALNTNPVYVLVRWDSTIRFMDDLSGRHVNVWPAGSARALPVQALLEALQEDVVKSYEPFEAAVAKLADGRIDAILTVGGYPPEGLQQVLASGRARMLSLSEAATRLVRRNHPFSRLVVIPRGLYNAESIRTIGIDRLLICRDGLDREVVYRVTQAFFESLPELTRSDPQLRRMDVENAQATPVPLHEGAARYYREQEQM